MSYVGLDPFHVDTLGCRFPSGPLGRHPAGRKVIFLGDLVDRGPSTPEVLNLVMSMVEADSAYCVQGNHEQKLMRKLAGRNVRVTHGLGETLQQLESTTEAFKERIPDFLKNLVSHYMFDDGKLVVSHAGLKEELQGRASVPDRESGPRGWEQCR